MKYINTSRGFLITIILLFVGFIWASIKPAAPYATFASTVGLIFGALAGKRLAQKAEWAQKNGEKPGE
jgi:hypothetical protein